MSSRAIVLRVVITTLVISSLGRADTIALGDISFNTLIPSAPGSPGVNDVAIDNFTGGFSLPPDFPAADPLTFLSSSVVLTLSGGSHQVISLGNLGPGSYTPSSLQFSAVQNFTSAVFTAMLSSKSFTLAGGSTFQAVSSQISIDLTPSSGAVLSPDIDFAFINVSNKTATPEPGTGVFVFSALAAAICLYRRFRASN